MVYIAALAGIWLALMVAPRLIVTAIALPLGVAFALDCRRTSRMIATAAENGRSGRPATGRRPNHAQRRALEADLRAAMRQTMFMSLLPKIAAAANGIAKRIDR